MLGGINSFVAKLNCFRIQSDKSETKVHSSIKSINNTQAKMPRIMHKLKNYLHNCFHALATNTKNTDKKMNIETRLVSGFEKTVKDVEKEDVSTQKISEMPPVIENLETNTVSPAFTELLDSLLMDKPNVLLILASNDVFSDNNFPLYFKQSKIEDYGEYTVSSFPCASSEKKVGDLDIDNRIISIAKNGQSASIRVVHVTNWSDRVITAKDWENITLYADKVGNERAMLRPQISLNHMVIHDFNDEYVSHFKSQNH